MLCRCRRCSVKAGVHFGVWGSGFFGFFLLFGGFGGDWRRRVGRDGEIASFDDFLNLGSVQGFVFEKGVGDFFEFVAVFADDAAGSLVAFVDEAFDFLIDFLSGAFAVVFASDHFFAEEYVVAVFAVLHHAQSFAHAELADHGAGDVGGLLDVSGGAG